MQNNKWLQAFYLSTFNTPLENYLAEFTLLLRDWEQNLTSKESTRWQKQLCQLPEMPNSELEITNKVILQNKQALKPQEIAKTKAVLKTFMPWRKGPFTFFDIDIDTEWRSDWKWDRVLPHIGDLSNQRILDVGCGSGYHLFRMHQAGAKQVIGIDPTALFFYQFQCFKHYLPTLNIHFLPLGIEKMPTTKSFDSVFSMGVLYHRQDPIKFLKELKDQLSQNGQLILETLVVEGDENTVFMPPDRYAQMRNVWFLPSVKALTLWLKRVGFKDIKCVDIDTTSIDEQRATEWMENHSLVDFLHKTDLSKTIEGHPAPKRAVIIAR